MYKRLSAVLTTFISWLGGYWAGFGLAQEINFFMLFGGLLGIFTIAAINALFGDDDEDTRND